MLVDTADAAGPNRKAMASIGCEVPPNVLYLPLKCLIHQVFRAIVTVLSAFAVMQDTFALVKVMHVQSKKEVLLKALREQIDVDLSTGYFIGVDPPANRTCEKWLVESLLWRRQFRDDCGKVFASQSDEMVIARGESLLGLLQGSWSRPGLQHFCSGPGCSCGGSRAAASATLFDLLAWLVVFSLPATPSFSRWPFALGGKERSETYCTLSCHLEVTCSMRFRLERLSSSSTLFVQLDTLSAWSHVMCRGFDV